VPGFDRVFVSELIPSIRTVEQGHQMTDTQIYFENLYPGFIARSIVAAATERARLNGVLYTAYNAQCL
jgi:hypothetical protein